MTDPVVDTHTKSTNPRSRNKPAALIAAIVLVVGVAVTAVVMNNNAAYAAETERLCTVSLKADKAALEDLKVSNDTAHDALVIVQTQELPGGAGTTVPYKTRPGAEAIKVVKPVKASEGVAEVKEVKAVPARPSGDKLLNAVLDSQNESLAISNLADSPATSCTTRNEAEKISKTASAHAELAVTMTDSVEVLLADHAIFVKEETVRLAAEKKAAEEAAAAEAARVAAEQAAAEQAAIDEANRQAQSNNNYSGGNGGYTGGGNSGGGGGGSTGGGGNSGGGGGGNIAPPPGQYGNCPAGHSCVG